VSDIAALILQVRVVGRPGQRRGRRASKAAPGPSPQQHHQSDGAVVGALTAVLADPSAELGELQHQRAVEQPVVAEVGVEGQQRVIELVQQVGVGPLRVCWAAWVSNPSIWTQ